MVFVSGNIWVTDDWLYVLVQPRERERERERWMYPLPLTMHKASSLVARYGMLNQYSELYHGGQLDRLEDGMYI